MGKKTPKIGQAPWLMPVILELREAEARGSLELRGWRPPWERRQNPASTKNTKLARHGGSLANFVVPATREAEVRGSPEPGRSKLQCEP